MEQRCNGSEPMRPSSCILSKTLYFGSSLSIAIHLKHQSSAYFHFRTPYSKETVQISIRQGPQF